jgi:hypothetical protein
VATRQVTVAKSPTAAVITATAAVTPFPVVVTATANSGQITNHAGTTHHWVVAAGSYANVAALVAAFQAARPLVTTAHPIAMATFATWAVGATTKITITLLTPLGAASNGQYFSGPTTTTSNVLHAAKLWQRAATGGLGANPVRLWQTTTAVAPDPTVTKANGLFQAGTANDPVPITIENLNATHSAWIAQGPGASAVTKSTGEELFGKASKTYSVVGNDQLYAVATTTTVKISVSVGRQ